MNSSDLHLRFPIGKMPSVKRPDVNQIDTWIKAIKAFPQDLKKLVGSLTQEELTWNYRTNGWSVTQIVHHCADSHMNSFIRFKLALTENKPTIRPYKEDLWAQQIDYTGPIEDSLLLLTGLHKRWGILLESLTGLELTKEFTHPENNSVINLGENIGIYAWHCEHHLAHIKLAIKSRGSFLNF